MAVVGRSTVGLAEDLGAVLAEELRNFRQLLGLLQREQAALKAAVAADVLAILREQEGALARIRSLEQQRSRLLTALAAPLGLPAAALTMSRLREAIPGAAAVLTSVSNELRTLLEEVKVVNERNGVLASRGLGFMDRLISHLTAALSPERAPAYGAQGRTATGDASLGLVDCRA
jgi:flagellar biosynthesis/type III secretory pathway chaperone